MTSTDIQQLYIAYYNRPADPAGFKYWSGVAATQDAMARAFGAGPEYVAHFQGMANRDIVKELYHNLFGRAGDAPGVTYWSGLLDNGTLKVADVALALLRGAQGSDAQVLANKAQLAQEWTVKAGVVAGDLPSTYIRNPGLMSDWLAQVTDASSLPVARANMDDAIIAVMGNTMETTVAISGQVQATGYLQHATVFVDSNNNGVLDTGELHTETDSHGHYLLMSSATQEFPLPDSAQLPDRVLVTGGVDISTGRVNTDTLSTSVQLPYDHGYLKNASLHAAITPLSTLRDALVAKGMTQAAAEAKLASAFGIDASAVGADTLATVFDAEAAQQAAALHAQAVNVQLDGVLTIVAHTLQQLRNPVLGPTASTGNTPPPPAWLTRAESQKAAIDSLASAIAGQQGAFSLDQTQTIEQVLKGAAALAPTATKVKAGLDAVNAVTLSAFDTIVAEAAGAVTKNTVSGTDIYTALAHIAQSGAAMTSIADALPVHVKANNAADLLAKFTGDALKTLTASETVYDIDPFSHADDAAIAAASGPAPASSKAAVEQLYVTLLGRPADPVELQNGMKQNAAALVATITGTDEYTHISQNSSVPGQIDRMYTNSFGHGADAGGLTYWSDLVNQHKTDIAGIAQSIALGAAGSDAVTIYNRTVAAMEFTTAISALGLESYYTGTNGHAFGNAWLPSVTDTTGLADAIASLPTLPGPVFPATTGFAQTGITDPHGWVL